MLRVLALALLAGTGLAAMEPPPWVVAVLPTPARDGDGAPGSGVVLAPGLVMTLAEALGEGATGATVVMPGGARRPARIVATGAATAVLLAVERMPALPVAETAHPRTLAVGSEVWTAGNSVGAIEFDGQVALSRGIISGVVDIPPGAPPVRGRGGQILSTYTGPAFEVDAAINDGDQGGAVLDADGRLVGLASLGRTRERRLPTMIGIDRLLRDLGRAAPERSANPAADPLAAQAASAAVSVVAVQLDRPRGPGNPPMVPRPARLPQQVPAYERERVRQEWDRFYHVQQIFYTDQPVSALVVGPREVLTAASNLHGGARLGRVLLPDGRALPCEVIATHAGMDLAVLRCTGDLGLPAAALAAPEVGLGEAIAIAGRDGPSATTLTTGVVSVVGRRVDNLSIGLLQIDALANYGNQGGAVVDRRGRIVGMPVRMGPDPGSRRWGINSGVALAVDGDSIRRELPGLLAGQSQEQGRYLGMGVSIDYRPNGAVIRAVRPDSGAAAAGLRRGDRLLSIDGQKVDGSETVHRILIRRKAGDRVAVALERDGEAIERDVELRELP